MAYEGYILKIGNWTVPSEYIEPSTYIVGNDRAKLAEWTDYAGERHVVYSNREQPQVIFETAKNFRLTDKEIGIIYEALKTAQVHGGTVPVYTIKYFDPTKNTYFTKTCTLDDVDFTINGINENFVVYEPARFVFRGVKPYASI